MPSCNLECLVLSRWWLMLAFIPVDRWLTSHCTLKQTSWWGLFLPVNIVLSTFQHNYRLNVEVKSVNENKKLKLPLQISPTIFLKWRFCTCQESCLGPGGASVKGWHWTISKTCQAGGWVGDHISIHKSVMNSKGTELIQNLCNTQSNTAFPYYEANGFK